MRFVCGGKGREKRGALVRVEDFLIFPFSLAARRGGEQLPLLLLRLLSGCKAFLSFICSHEVALDAFQRQAARAIDGEQEARGARSTGKRIREAAATRTVGRRHHRRRRRYCCCSHRSRGARGASAGAYAVSAGCHAATKRRIHGQTERERCGKRERERCGV